MVATPIGNLADISLRALHVLALVDCVACEDTRHTQTLLRAFGIDKPAHALLAVHQHNEAQAALHVIDRLRGGQRVAYVSDAGTPGVSDPGARLVAAVRAAQLRVVPLPGASSVTTALCAAGVGSESGFDGGFVFAGFLPIKAAERASSVEQLRTEPRPVLLLEAPHRIEALAAALAVLGDRNVTVARELTKQFEDITTTPAAALPNWFAADTNRTRGEFVIVLHGAPQQEKTGPDLKVLVLLMAELPLKTAVRLAADITGQARNELYDAALGLKKSAGAPNTNGGIDNKDDCEDRNGKQEGDQ